MERKLQEYVGVSTLFTIPMPDPQNPQKTINVKMVYDFLEDAPNISPGNDWWRMDSKNGVVHVLVGAETRKEYLELYKRRSFGEPLTVEENRKIEDSEAILQTMSMLAAERAIKRFYGIIATEIPEKRENRTLRKAGAVSKIPSQLTTIVDPNYRNTTSLYQSGNAYLQPIVNVAGGLTYKDNTIFFQGVPASMAILKDYFTDSVPEDLDLTFLQFCFSIILQNFNTTMLEDYTVNQVISIYYPKFAEAAGKSKNISRSDVESFISKIMSFQSIIGVIDGELQPVLIYAGEDKSRNLVYLSSPYLVKVAQTLYNVRIRKDKNGVPQLKGDGTPLLSTKLVYSDLINGSIMKSKSNYAKENVRIIVSLIENKPHQNVSVSAAEIIEMNPQLKMALEGKPAAQKNVTLKRVFKKTMELLQSETKLSEVYKDIQLPDPTISNNIPSSSTLESTVYTFRHRGKKR